MDKYLSETRYLDYSNGIMQRILTKELNIDQLDSPKDRALAIHDYVREKI